MLPRPPSRPPLHIPFPLLVFGVPPRLVDVLGRSTYHTERYSQEGSSDAAFDCQYCSSRLLLLSRRVRLAVAGVRVSRLAEPGHVVA